MMPIHVEMYGRNIGTDTIGYALSQEYKFTPPGAALDERRPGKAKNYTEGVWKA